MKVPEHKILHAPYLVSQPDIENESGQALSEPCLRVSEFRASLPENTCVFLFVGKLLRLKGLIQLFEAFANLTENDKSRYRLWIVGDGEDRRMLERRAEEHGLGDRVVFFGRFPYSQLHCFYKNADVFVFPTLRDYRALVGFEALHFGLPVLHSRLDGAVDEIVMEGKNGFSFDPYDINQLTGHIEWFIRNPEQREQFGLQSKIRSSAFTVETAARSLVHATRLVANSGENSHE